MTKKIDTTILLAQYYDSKGIIHAISIADYLGMVNIKDKEAIADFLYNRLHARYLKPFFFNDNLFNEQYKNGFSIMANCCMLIETLESFKQGLGDSNRKSKQLFNDFLANDLNFSVFQSRETEFYFSIRCGILHQGETTNGWIISRKGTVLFDPIKLKVNAVIFMQNLEESLKDYCLSLVQSDWSDLIWQNFLKKMSVSIANCSR